MESSLKKHAEEALKQAQRLRTQLRAMNPTIKMMRDVQQPALPRDTLLSRMAELIQWLDKVCNDITRKGAWHRPTRFLS